ncbi:hypothetical protein M1247_12695 [Mycobacterium sp. 21AC1]|uniref:hypothetical protein n=1 Tax=[Mycobacterium] appelbergii TaxID=2939269 RepID=UPI002939418E|nr:hypothetical protein [Mycobacterium sp. 21AC1]MDV3125778.1 hypothetical protein [Mycobacterium sp. 21AC1]
MGTPGPRQPCYLAEWYQAALTDDQLDRAAAKLDECAASMSADGTAVRLLMTLAVPSDEVVFGVFAAASAQLVAQACHRAGLPPQRLTVASRLTGPRRETPDSSPTRGP